MNRAQLLYSVLESPRPITPFGHGNGKWNVIKEAISADPTFVCAGVGKDISFDLALLSQYKCRMFLLDPSPTGKATIEKQSPLPSDAQFLPVGLAAKDAMVTFLHPVNSEEGSFRVASGTGQEKEISFQCCRLKTLMAENHISKIDLLKIDIEGFEYDVLSDIMRSKLPITQICVEFHHGIVPGISRWKTLSAIINLRFHGYILCDHDGLNHTFLHKSALA